MTDCPGAPPRRDYGPPLPREYHRECGPGAIAALTGLARREAARRLWGHTLFWREPGQSFENAEGTPAFASLDVLLRFGWGADWYSYDGALIADTETVVASQARTAEARVRGGARPLPRRRRALGAVGERGEDAPAVGGARETDATTPELETLAASAHPLSWWLARHRAGYWLYHVQLDGGRGGHVLATHGSEILSGAGPGMSDWPVLAAFRVHPPRTAARSAVDTTDVATAAPLAAATIHTPAMEDAKMTTTVESEAIDGLADLIEAGGAPEFDGEAIATAILERLDEMLTETEAAASIASETRRRLDRAVKLLAIARTRRGAEAGIDLATFRRLGLIEAGGETLVSRRDRADGSESQPAPHLFRSLADQHRRFRDLVAIPASLEERVRKRLEGEARRRGRSPAIDDQTIRDAVREAAIKAAVSGDLEGE